MIASTCKWVRFTAVSLEVGNLKPPALAQNLLYIKVKVVVPWNYRQILSVVTKYPLQPEYKMVVYAVNYPLIEIREGTSQLVVSSFQ